LTNLNYKDYVKIVQMVDFSFDEIYQSVLNKIIGFLAYRSRSRKEIEIRLEKYLKSFKKSDEATRSKVRKRIISYLEESKLIDDAEFTQQYIESKIKSKKALGKYAIASKLMIKGISREEASLYLERMVSEADEVTLVCRLLAKKFKFIDQSTYGDLEIQNRMVKYSMSRGFSYPISKKAVDYLAKRP
jgi:SOS response regulatory protein OraA/RecX